MEEKLWKMLYNIEDYLQYDNTKMGKKLGNFINDLQQYKVIIKKKIIN